MELEEAASRIQIMLNFYKGMEKMAEVVDVVRKAENLIKERLAAAEMARRDLEEAKLALTEFARTSAGVMKQAESKFAEAELFRARKAKELDEALMAKAASVNAAMQEATNKHILHVAQLAEEEKALQEKHDSLSKKVSELEKAFTALQSKAAKLGA